MSRSELKNLAQMAKQRLRGADYGQESTGALHNYKRTNSYFMKNLASIKKMSANCEFVVLNDEEDLKFYKKVVSMLKANEDIYNPIGKLVDDEYFSTLNSAEQQLYVLKISEKYNLAKDAYFKEQQAKSAY